MSREPEIALVLSAESWVDALHRHCADHGGVRVRCLVLESAVALDEEFDVMVAGERWPALTRTFVDVLHDRGRRVLVVGDPQRRSELAACLGVDGVVAADVAPPMIVNAVLDLLADAEAGAEGRPHAERQHAGAVEVDAATSAAPRTQPVAFVAVGGPCGAGSTEMAIAIAARRVGRGARAVLVDADTGMPSIAPRLGLPLEPNLCSAVDAATLGLGSVAGTLFDLGGGWPAVLVGAPSRRAGRALSGVEVVAVGDILVRRFRPVVFDLGGLSRAADDVALAVAARASVVVGVGAATPVGVLRLVEWLDGVRAAAPRVPVYLVVNRAPSSRARRAELTAELREAANVVDLTFAPSDARVDDAVWSAAPVRRGPFARAAAAVQREVMAVLDAAGSSPSDPSATAAIPAEPLDVG